MLTLVLIGTTLAVVAGLITKLVVDRTSIRDTGTISLTELGIGSLICALVLMPSVAAIGISIARADAVTYNEYWSGLEQTAPMSVTNCTKDGSCAHEYDCDSYIVMVDKTRQVPYTTTETYTKPDGGTGVRTVTKYRTEHYQEPETRWHSCPYVQHEYTYTVTDTLGQTYTIGSHWFPNDPNSDRWHGDGWNDPRWSSSLPGNVPTGQPALWVAAKDRIAAGKPGGTTQVHTYKNYILASQKDIYAKASDAIDTYKSAGQMPTPVTGIYDFYRANKVYFVGHAPSNAKDWQDAAARFNGHFGSDRQGDLHVIVVTDPKVTNPDEYAHAVEAYWQSPALGKNALSKNGYVIILGASADGQTIAWARGFSGMPMGNERVAVDVREALVGDALSPAALFDTTDDGQGYIDDILMNPDGGFKRVEMKDYSYLYAQIQPTTGQKILILLIGLVLALGVWAVFVAVDIRMPEAVRKAWNDARRARRIDEEIANLKH